MSGPTPAVELDRPNGGSGLGAGHHDTEAFLDGTVLDSEEMARLREALAEKEEEIARVLPSPAARPAQKLARPPHSFLQPWFCGGVSAALPPP